MTNNSLIDLRQGFTSPFMDRFTVQREWETRSHSISRLAKDNKTSERVVLKSRCLRDVPPGYIMRLQHEVGILSRLENLYYASPREVITDGDLVHIIFPYVKGKPLRTTLQAEPMPVDDVFRLAQCLLSALRDLHENRIIHRALRPSNIIVHPRHEETFATLIDLGSTNAGLSQSIELERMLDDARYFSPEQAGVIDHDLTQSSDLYSVGILLFECLSGSTPFRGSDLNSLLFSHMTDSVPELRTLGIGIPGALDEVIQRLLRKDPRDRYQSADAVLTDINAIGKHWQQGRKEANVVIGSSDIRGTLVEPAFVSRDAELQVFDQKIEAAFTGEAGLILLEGASGGGKSRLLAEVAQRATKRGFRVFKGLGSNEVALHPLNMLGGVVKKFLADCKAEQAFARHVQESLEHDLDVVAASMPEISKFFQTISALSGPELTGEVRTIRALTRFMSALGTPEKPALVILDDCQWADDLTYKLIRQWQKQCVNEEPSFVLLIVAFRSEEVGDSHTLRMLDSATHLTLEPFNNSEIRRLAESMAGRLPEEALELIVQLSGGSPFMASAVLHGLVESGTLVNERSQWQMEPMARGRIHSSDREATFLTKRLELLSEDVLEYLSAGAIIGKEFDIQFAATLTAMDAADAISAVDTARQRQLIWCRPDGVTCVFVHDMVRRALLDRQTPDSRRMLHLQVAEYLQRYARKQVSELAYHFDAAGESDKAFPYALLAAEQARTRHALETAEQQYHIAHRGSQKVDAQVRFQVSEGLGDVLMLRGKYEAAGRLFEEATQFATDEHEKAQIRGKLAELSFKRGDMETAVRDYEAALRSLNHWIPRSNVLFVAWVLWEVLIQFLHTVLPSLFVNRRATLPSRSQRLTIRLYSGLAHGYWYCRGSVCTLWSHLRGLNLAERYPPTPELGNAYSEHAPVMSLLGLFPRAIQYAKKSLEIRRNLGDLWGQGQSLHYYGIVLYAASRYNECIQRCQESIRLLERMGDYWQVHIARYQIAASYYRLGDFRMAIKESKKNHRSGIELGDEQASGIILDIWARASLGKVPRDVVDRELARQRNDAQGQAQVLFASGICHLHRGDVSLASQEFDEALGIAKRAGICNSYTLPILTWSVTAYRRQAESVSNYTPNRRNRLIRLADRAAWKAKRASWRCGNDLPHILREQAMISSLQGRERKARRLFAKSLRVAAQQGSRYEYAITLDSYIKVALEFGWAVSEADVEKARTALGDYVDVGNMNGHADQFHVAPPSLSLIDRFDTILESGRKVATGLSESHIYKETYAAACRLLRVDHGVILEIDPQRPVDRWRVLVGSLSWKISEELVRESLTANRSLSTHSDLSDGDNSRTTEEVERSALCAPLYMRGKAVACLYVMHPEVRGLFGVDEERLADFLSTIAGAALENAEGFAELQELNVSLEQRVADRTAAAEARSRELAASNQELERIACELRQAQIELSASKQAAEAASEAKSRFLATMSHEIRTPMNGILGMADLALGSSLTDRQRGYLVTLKDSANALLTLLNDLLDFSKIEAGKMELEAIQFSLWDVVVDASRLLAISAGRKGLNLICRVQPDVPTNVIGDPNRLRQIMLNLLGNSIKFTMEGEVATHVRIVEQTEGCARIQIIVQDSGVGIPAEKQQWIFEAFHQTDSSVTRRFGGTGLGLAISSQLVELMGGMIRVESQEGQGTTFFVEIPLALPERTDAQRVPKASPIERELVLISDHSASRVATCELLDYLGFNYKVIDPTSHLPQQEKFPVLILDLSVNSQPTLHAAMQRVFEGVFDPDDMICLVPAGQADMLACCEALAVEQVLTKPVKAEELLQAVQKTLHQCPPQTQPVESTPSSNLPSLRILVADDSSVNRDVASGMLELCGHFVETVADGEEAVARIREQSFDLVFMDLEMPILDGLAASRAIRQLPGSKSQIPIYAMTAHALEEINERCLDAGMDGTITKPIMPDQLLALLESVCTLSG